MKTKFLKATLLVCLVCCLSSCEKGFDMIGIPRTYYLSSEGKFDATCKVLQNEATVEATMLADTEHAKLIVRMDNEADTISAKKVTRTYKLAPGEHECYVGIYYPSLIEGDVDLSFSTSRGTKFVVY